MSAYLLINHTDEREARRIRVPGESLNGQLRLHEKPRDCDETKIAHDDKTDVH